MFSYYNRVTTLSVHSTLIVCFCLYTACHSGKGHTEFSLIKEVEHTSVKNQGISQNCWIYATVSFLESECLRHNNLRNEFSVAYILSNSYKLKAIQSIGKKCVECFVIGGEAHDVINVIRNKGIIPAKYINEDSLDTNYDEYTYQCLSLFIKNSTCSTQINMNQATRGIDSILEKNIGPLPIRFKYRNNEINPIAYFGQLGLNLNDYIELTSYSNYKSYSMVKLDIPDNWSSGYYVNLPYEEFLKSAYKALDNGFSFVWDGDVSEEGFSISQGIAILSEDSQKLIIEHGIDSARLITFRNKTTTDNHLMHIIGYYKDRKGNKYFKAKNSYGTNSGIEGYIFMSEEYFSLKTISIMINKKSIPNKIDE
jgi:bleomycin hydrolase